MLTSDHAAVTAHLMTISLSFAPQQHIKRTIDVKYLKFGKTVVILYYRLYFSNKIAFKPQYWTLTRNNRNIELFISYKLAQFSKQITEFSDGLIVSIVSIVRGDAYL